MGIKTAIDNQATQVTTQIPKSICNTADQNAVVVVNTHYVVIRTMRRQHWDSMDGYLNTRFDESIGEATRHDTPGKRQGLCLAPASATQKAIRQPAAQTTTPGEPA